MDYSTLGATFCFKLLAAAAAVKHEGRNLDQFQAALPDGTTDVVEARDLRKRIFFVADSQGVQPKEAASLYREELGRLFFTAGHPLQKELTGLSPRQIFGFTKRVGFYVTGDEYQANLLAGNVATIILDVTRNPNVTARYGADFAAERFRALKPQFDAAQSGIAPGDIDAKLGLRGLSVIVEAYRKWAYAGGLLHDDRPSVRPVTSAREVPVMGISPDSTAPIRERPAMPTVSVDDSVFSATDNPGAGGSNEEKEDDFSALERELNASGTGS